MLFKRIKRHVDSSVLKEESRKIGVNLVTAGIVGVFIYHYVGTSPVSMLWASGLINLLGIVFLVLGSTKKEGDN